MNVSEYIPEVRDRLQIAADDPVLTDVQILSYLNQALQAISTKKDWPWLYDEAEATVEHGVLYGLPGNHTKTVFITVNGQELTSAGVGDLARYRGTFGPPQYYSVIGDFVDLSPSVAENTTYPLVHGFYRTEPTLITSLDAPLLPDQYAEWLITEAAVRAAVRANRSDRVAAYRDEAARLEAGAFDNVRRSGPPPRIKRTRPSIWQDVN